MADTTVTSSVLEKTMPGSSDFDDDSSSKDGSQKNFSSYRIVLKRNLAEDVIVLQAAESLGVPITVVDEFLPEEAKDVLSIWVVSDFDETSKNGQNYRILGRTALLELAEKKETLKNFTRPLFCHAMSGLVICLTGYKSKDEVERLKELVHHMGGSMRKDMNFKVTHLIAKSTGGEKYCYGVTFRVPIVSDSWVHDAWSNKHVIGFCASDPDFVSRHKMKPFHGLRVCFLGFPEEEKSHMTEILLENGGECTNLTDSSCTHLVMDESSISIAPRLKNHKTHIVKANWFWASVQNEGRENEDTYRFEDTDSMLSPLGLNNSTPLSFSGKTRKRKRLRPRFPSLGNDFSTGQSAQKRRSSASDARLSDASTLDYTASPDITDDRESPVREKSKNSNQRYHRFLELCQTESNYVNILNTIMTLFKATLEEMVDTDSQLLNATELKIIFGNVPPIYQTHKSMLDELKHLASQWNENISIGDLFLKYSGDLVKAYVPFINFFENTRDMLVKCDKTKPRFHAFLKICQTKPECGRESLQDLLIRPVQRLPSINLLLADILRHTPKTNSDHKALEAAIASMDEVMTRMNEDKRRTEGQVALFDIFNDIDNCPAHLVSSQRCFINRCDVTELSENLSGRGNSLALFLFSDVIEVCKKRMKAFNSLKSPKENASSKHHPNVKLYKHVTLISLSSVKKVIDINETDECHGVFALIVKCTQDTKDKLYTFTITDESLDKAQYLKSLCKQIATCTCRTDTENLVATLDAQQLDITSSEVSSGTLGRAINKFATKTKMKVGRAFSFNKTPSKLKRAVSTMMSPFGSQSRLTPSTQLASLQLASLSSIPNFGTEMSVVPFSLRKIKSSSFTMGSLKRF